MKRILLVGYLTVLTVTLGGGAIYAAIERTSYLKGSYWALTTATTVGYGDVVPRDDAGRIYSMVVMLVAIPAVAWAFAQLTSSLATRKLRHTHDIHRIVADIHELLTGENHPDAPR